MALCHFTSPAVCPGTHKPLSPPPPIWDNCSMQEHNFVLPETRIDLYKISFYYCSLYCWNALPLKSRLSLFLSSFKSPLKMHLFLTAFPCNHWSSYVYMLSNVNCMFVDESRMAELVDWFFSVCIWRCFEFRCITFSLYWFCMYCMFIVLILLFFLLWQCTALWVC